MLITIIIGIGVAFGIGKSKNKSNAKYKIVVSNFASYDFLRAIIGENKDVELTFLIGPGKDAHSYDPTAQDLIKKFKIQIYSYMWVEKWKNGLIK